MLAGEWKARTSELGEIVCVLGMDFWRHVRIGRATPLSTTVWMGDVINVSLINAVPFAYGNNS